MKVAGKREFDVIGLGEVMMRLSPPDNERIAQGNIFEKNAGNDLIRILRK